jgi:hypothetical protein
MRGPWDAAMLSKELFGLCHIGVFDSIKNMIICKLTLIAVL